MLGYTTPEDIVNRVPVRAMVMPEHWAEVERQLLNVSADIDPNCATPFAAAARMARRGTRKSIAMPYKPPPAWPSSGWPLM